MENITLVCSYCHVLFERPMHRYRYAIKKNTKSFYCSAPCKKHCRERSRTKYIEGILYVECSRCRQYKDESSILKDNNKKSKMEFRRWCKECEALYRLSRKDHMKEYLATYRYTAVARWNALKRSATNGNRKKRPLTYIDCDTFSIWLKDQQMQCTYCCRSEDTLGVPLGIDRKDSRLGYVSENICLCCRRCNTAKSNIFTHAQFIEIANKYLSENNNTYDDFLVHEKETK